MADFRPECMRGRAYRAFNRFRYAGVQRRARYISDSGLKLVFRPLSGDDGPERLPAMGDRYRAANHPDLLERFHFRGLFFRYSAKAPWRAVYAFSSPGAAGANRSFRSFMLAA